MTEQPGVKSDQRPDLSVIVVNYNTGFLLERMFSALDASRGGLVVQIIVVDNASRDDSVAILRAKYTYVELVTNQTNVGFGRANNQAVPLVRGRYVLLLNTDAFVSPDTLTKTIGFMDKNPQCGILGVKLVGENGELQPCCRYFPTPWNVFLTRTGLDRIMPGARLVDDMNWDHGSVRNCDWVPGCYYLIRREVIERIGLFDSRYFLYCEEIDHCRSVKNAGWKVTYYGKTEVLHIGGESAKSDDALTHRQIPALQIESELLYFRKYLGLWGVCASIALAVLGDVISALKALIARRRTAPAISAVRHTSIVLQKALATRLGSRATR